LAAVVHESAADLAALQVLIDRSYAGAGRHLLSIHDPPRRMSAVRVAERLTGMCLLALATVTADARPIVGPVDGIFFLSSALHAALARCASVGLLPPPAPATLMLSCAVAAVSVM
jgi:hypothetical protein